MLSRRFWLALLVSTVAAAAVAAIGFARISSNDAALWALLAATVLWPIGLFLFWPRAAQLEQEEQSIRDKILRDQQALEEQKEAFDRVRLNLQVDIEAREGRLNERERDLASRFIRFHEFLEYPLEDVHADKTSGQLQKLSEYDRAVQKLLEAEAERVYEKIRQNGYTDNGKVDVAAIRSEAMQFMKQVARVYNPTSQHPLLETSFEQLARATSRICLHVLVLLEQLPGNVQHYNANKLYGYVQKAIASYGVYQKASPWLSYLSRGLYAGKLISAANPAALGAWWLATELGKKGAKKVVENVIDRQVVATLHDVVTVIGVEIAGIYGTGFRQRDPAWILGAELVELVHSFPMSGESLRNGLRHVTALRLRSEYDRIYLYRCMANHKSVGMQLADPAMLTREEREVIARQLETFFTSHIHGATDASLRKWRDAFERRFDMRLNLENLRTGRSVTEREEVQSALNSLAGFLQSAVGLSVIAAMNSLKDMRVPARIGEADRAAVIAEACHDAADASFAPPVLDPGSDITNEYLQDLATSCTLGERPADHLDDLAGEISRYFRHPVADMQNLLEAAWRTRAKLFSTNSQVSAHLGDGVARAFLLLREESEKLAFCYGDLTRKRPDRLDSLPNSWLLGLARSDSQQGRAIVVDAGRDSQIVWESNCPLHTARVSGLFLDGAEISDGRWREAAVSDKEQAILLVSGSIRGGRFRTYFKDLLAFSKPLDS